MTEWLRLEGASGRSSIAPLTPAQARPPNLIAQAHVQMAFEYFQEQTP